MKDFLAALIEVVLSTESEVTVFHGTILVMKCKLLLLQKGFNFLLGLIISDLFF